MFLRFVPATGRSLRLTAIALLGTALSGCTVEVTNGEDEDKDSKSILSDDDEADDDESNDDDDSDESDDKSSSADDDSDESDDDDPPSDEDESNDEAEETYDEEKPDAGLEEPAETPVEYDSGLSLVPEKDYPDAAQPPPEVEVDPDTDADEDGWTVGGGDCDDHDIYVNPGAWDFGGNGVDDDCNGTIDDGLRACDDNLEIDDDDPYNAARAIGLCALTTEDSRSWGVLSAKYVFADGSSGVGDGDHPASVQHGLLPKFGDSITKAIHGDVMLALSSGTARDPDQPGFINVDDASFATASDMPPGFPVSSNGCEAGGSDANDPVALEVQIRVPTNAHSFGFVFNYFTSEFPEFVCSSWNDYFVVLQDPAPATAISGNISFDSEGNPVSVNAVFLEVCEPQFAGGREFECPRGSGQLAGTGYDGTGATGWLETRSSVEPGSIMTLRFATWDTGDWILNGTALIDGFNWSNDELEGGGEPFTVEYEP